MRFNTLHRLRRVMLSLCSAAIMLQVTTCTTVDQNGLAGGIDRFVDGFYRSMLSSLIFMIDFV